MIKKQRTRKEVDAIKHLQQSMVDALRVVIYAVGSLRYAAFESLQPLIYELKKIDPTLSSPQILDFKKDIEKIIESTEKLNQKCKMRFVASKDHEVFEDRAYATYQCDAALSYMSDSDVFQEAMRLSKNDKNYAKLSEQVKFMDKVLDKARSSNHDAIRMIQERRDVLESIAAEPYLIKDGEVKIYDIAPEREEVEVS
ncbi:hypothetical protein ACR79K_22535 [Sphingobacterium siyangense]|uniref:hypothetical protein n=1 Tax=Sphingobacterium siyangense TaxID=459529 RepID=UPI003DA40D54